MVSASEILEIINTSKLSLEKARKEGLLPISTKDARNLLHDSGFRYDRNKKKWVLHTFQIPKIDFDVFGTETKATPADNSKLTDDELTALKQLAQESLSDPNSDAKTLSKNVDVQLYMRTRKLEKGKTTRKTYVVEEQLATRFDAIAERSNIDKSQLLALALTDFLTKYDG